MHNGALNCKRLCDNKNLFIEVEPTNKTVRFVPFKSQNLTCLETKTVVVLQ